MNKILGIVIGITLFILIIGATYTQMFVLSSNNDTQYTQEQIVYNGKLPIPVENFIKVTSGFGYRNPLYNSAGVQVSGGKTHYGIDLVGIKNSKVFAAKSGLVTFAGQNGGYGNCVEIKHTNDNGTIFYTFYAHMKDNSLQVQVGQEVHLGQILGTQGTTGNSTGDHLHFEVRLEDKTQVDPAPYLFYKKEVG